MWQRNLAAGLIADFIVLAGLVILFSARRTLAGILERKCRYKKRSRTYQKRALRLHPPSDLQRRFSNDDRRGGRIRPRLRFYYFYNFLLGIVA